MNSPIVALVTGGTGFVGRRLVRALLELGATVRLVTSGTNKPDYILGADERISWFGYSYDQLCQATVGVTHFFNFAVVYDRPALEDRTIYAVNVELPLHLLSLLKGHVAPVTCVLGDTFFRKFPAGATSQSRYTRSKSELALRLEQFCLEPTLRIALLQIEQVYGPGEAFSKALPAVTKQMVQDVERIAMTSGLQRRDFIYVDDVVAAALTVASAVWHGCTVVECGSGVATPVREVFEIIHSVTGSNSQLGFGDIKTEQAIEASVGDISWLLQRGWRPRTSIHVGLQALVTDIQTRIRTEC